MTRITFNNLTKADGSALIDQDHTIVQAIVFGPVDVAQSKVNYEEAIVEIIFKPKISIPSTSPAFEAIREIEDMLRQIFKEIILVRLHPRTAISILIQEIYNNGSLLSAAINAVCCALLDAGLPMKCPVAGVSIQNPEVADCTFDFVFDSSLDLVTIITRGCASEESIEKAMKLGQEEAKKSFDCIRERVRERFSFKQQVNDT